jgi:outer membrane protein OmpA-like peptidoglycan-associated protein
LKRPRLIIEEGGAKVPGYIVTFSDMVTLLLTFFVMLLTLASTQDPELFNKGRDSFLDSLRYIGLGLFFGKGEAAPLGQYKIKHYIDNPDELADKRTIDAKAEELRRILERLKQMSTIVPSEIAAKRANFSIANVHFSPGSDDLDGSAKTFLSGFSRDLQQDTGREPVDLYVLGLAPDGKSEKEQWLLSARRAQKVADFLRSTLSSNGRVQRQLGPAGGRSKWSVYSWGAGPGGDWVGRDSPISKRSQILIAVLRTSD